MYDRWLPVADNTQVAPRTYLMELRCREMAAAARPGQFLMIRPWSGLDPLLRRPFSICAVLGHDRIRVLYRVVGRGTEILSSLSSGERVRVLGPLGNGFDPPGEKKRSILVGGGIGLAPLVFLSQRLGETPFRLLQGFSSLKEVIPPAVLGLPEDAFVLATDDGSAGHQGFVTDLLGRILQEPSGAPEAIFACGPPAMLRKTAHLAEKHGISCQVSLEARMACGVGACQGCAVTSAPGDARPYVHVCRDGPVFDAAVLDWRRTGQTGQQDARCHVTTEAKGAE